MKRTVLIAIAILAIVPFISAAVVTVGGDVGNEAPCSVTACELYITNSTSACGVGDYGGLTSEQIVGFTPGTDYLCARVTVTDPNGNSDIDLTALGGTRVLLWGSGSAEADADPEAAGGHGWDHHYITSFNDCLGNPITSLSDSDTEFCAELAPDTDVDLLSDAGLSFKDISGAGASGWSVKVYIQDYTGAEASDTIIPSASTGIGVATTAGLGIYLGGGTYDGGDTSSACTFSGGTGTGTALICSGVTDGERIQLRHEGNIAIDTTEYMSVPFSVGSGDPDDLAGDQFYRKLGTAIPPTVDLASINSCITATDCVAINDVGSPAAIDTTWGRGTPDTSATTETYQYLILPVGLLPGSYGGGQITIEAA